MPRRLMSLPSCVHTTVLTRPLRVTTAHSSTVYSKAKLGFKVRIIRVPALLEQLLNDCPGFVVSDWGATHDTAEDNANAGLDME